MAEEIKICKLILKGYDQFKDIELDFTDPKTGEPLEKICFIGRNGTGKSKLLNVIKQIVGYRNLGDKFGNYKNVICACKFKYASNYFYTLQIGFSNQNDDSADLSYGLRKGIQTYLNSNTEIEPLLSFANREKISSFVLSNQSSVFLDVFGDLSKQNFLMTFVPSEDQRNPLLSLNDVPSTTLSNALNSSEKVYELVSPTTINSFWERLMSLIQKRAQNQEEFEKNNLDKTKRQLIEEFDKVNPKVLETLATIWNEILAKTGLEFDIENAKIPIQLNENLQAYIRLKDSKERIKYSELSTGIRNFIFKIGHIYSLYFDREVKSGVLLLDEPENSLYPDFLYDLIDIYKQATTDKRGMNNTQMFVATHSPIIAAQFRPEERIILDFDDEGGVTARRGSTPEGDDPNDILKKDFAIRSLLGKKGIEKWERYLDLKSKLHDNPKGPESNEWRKEFLKIGEDYNFES